MHLMTFSFDITTKGVYLRGGAHLKLFINGPVFGIQKPENSELKEWGLPFANNIKFFLKLLTLWLFEN